MISCQGYHIVNCMLDQDDSLANSIAQAPYCDLHGIQTLYVLQHKQLNAYIVISAKRNCIIYPILDFSFTVVMNALSLNHFTCFYLDFTFKKQGIIHNLGFPPTTHQRFLLFCNLGHLPQKHIRNLNYFAQGYQLRNTPSQLDWKQNKKCTQHCCQLLRYTDDNSVYHISFGSAADKAIAPLPLNPLIAWSFGSYKCNLNTSTGMYKCALVRLFFLSVFWLIYLSHL